MTTAYSDSELKSEIMNDISSVEGVVLITDKKQILNINTSEKQCGDQTSLSFNGLEVGDSNEEPNEELNVGSSEEKDLSTSSYKDCNILNHVSENSPIDLANNKLETNSTGNQLNSNSDVNNCEELPKSTQNMGDDECFPCWSNESNSNSNAASECKEVEDPKLESQYVVNEKTNEDNRHTCNVEESLGKRRDLYTTPQKYTIQTESAVESQGSEVSSFKQVSNQGMFYSTPNVSRNAEDTNNVSVGDTFFGYVSPLNVKCSQGKNNLKRKHVGLEPIEETNEDSDSITEKKLRIGENNPVVDSEEFSSKLQCFEAPAKSLLKMWQPSCLSRNMSSGFIVLDECGDSEAECSKADQENPFVADSSKVDTSKLDDFEIACQSLTEAMMKSSSHIETLEKYHSQVQLENQLDDEKFNEIWKELSMNVDLDDNTCFSLLSMDESTITNVDKTCLKSIAMDQSNDADSKVNNDGFASENVTIVEGNMSDVLSSKEMEGPIASVKKESDDQEHTNYIEDSKSKIKEEPQGSDEEESDDEEKVLLEGNNNENDYEFFEFVSSDPKENEDNYNPEWQKLGRLTTDEERYKAVRDRWRSLVPPDPNRNLTYRQWRARNKLSPIEFTLNNNNYHTMDDNKKKRLCTAIFKEKINSIAKDLEDTRMDIYRKRNREFELLGHAQDEEQLRARMSGYPDLGRLHSYHLNQCRSVKEQFDLELKRIEEITEAKIRILRDAEEEVLLFQKFYKGVGAQDDTEMYLTEIQVQELMETEEMLEKYKEMYN
ncbi:uncharacterized protein LOC128985456 isoform X2 [Macrosteles quadrilineatus]|uniref:uncharacterized protein LOC128985456 isoform X2 n=1 Tax=Macrosteles quadrilineatus TaxID=74068 RepID=UPI0023E100CC|nr:uncharacterized protein LOC128985456 isoform X2 [Macrosteles quadrilineatus]